MLKKLLHIKNTTQKKRSISEEDMAPSEERAKVIISSSLESIEQEREVFFQLKGEDLTIDHLNVSDDSYSLYFVDGTVKRFSISKGKSIINNIISDLKSGRIKSEIEYDIRKFEKMYLKELLDQKATTTSLQEGSTTEEVKHETQTIGATGSVTAELSNSSQSEESTTEGVSHEMQEDSEYVAAALKQQKFDFVSTNATENTSDVMKEIKRSNTSNGITTESIRGVVFRSTSRNVSAFSEFNSTDATLPKLPNESGITGTTVAGLSTLSIGIILGLLGAAVGLGCCLWNRRNKKSISDIEKGNGVEGSLPEVGPLLNKVEIKSGAYKSFRSNIQQ